MTHFNIGQKIEINPFDNVRYVKLPNYITNEGITKLSALLNRKACSVETRKVNDTWTILFNVELLNFTTLLKWIAPYRGVFFIGNSSIHFLIEDDIMNCW